MSDSNTLINSLTSCCTNYMSNTCTPIPVWTTDTTTVCNAPYISPYVIEIKENDKMINNDKLFGKIDSKMCRISMDGKIAIYTSNGYKTFDIKTGELTNCDQFALEIAGDFFFLIPTNKVTKGDIILVGGKPKCVLDILKNEIKVLSYEDGTIASMIPETHMFLGKGYLYGKIVCLFGDMTENGSVKKMMKLMMFREMMNGGSNTNNVFGAMMFMNMLNDKSNLFDGLCEEEDDK